MLITKAVETPEGNVVFSGELQKDELDFVIEIGLNIILANGAQNFMSEKTAAAKNVVVSSGETH